MYNTIIIRNGEISIKGQNRPIFEKKLIKNIKRSLCGLEGYKVYKADGRLYIDFDEKIYNDVIDRIEKVIGIASFSPAIRLEKGYENLKEACLKLLLDLKDNEKYKTFKVDIKRQNKTFPMTSPEMSRDIGGYLLKTIDGALKVDVQNPDLHICGEFRDNENLIYAEKFKGQGGMPVGVNGKGLMLLSGGIDSPVAMYMGGKRGLQIDAVHFHSFPYTNERSKEKVIELAKIISTYTGDIKLYMVNILPIQKAVNKNCHEELMTIISRRFMMRIAEKVAKQNESQCIFTGESLGQVASQTVEGLTATNKVVEDLPVLRPLIAYDKEDIIKFAKKIGTFETSIIPEEDCCTVFLPKNPATKPKLTKILDAETYVDVEGLVNQVIDDMEVIEISTF